MNQKVALSQYGDEFPKVEARRQVNDVAERFLGQDRCSISFFRSSENHDFVIRLCGNVMDDVTERRSGPAPFVDQRGPGAGMNANNTGARD